MAVSPLLRISLDDWNDDAMQSANHPVGWKAVCAALVVWIANAGSVNADLYQHYIRTVEWLVDNSDVIAVTRESANGSEAPIVLRTLKGDAARIKWPLEKSRVEYHSYYAPPSDGPVRIIFVRGASELLGSVQLGRKRLDATKVHDILYGVTQYGRLLLNQSDLFDAIDAQLQSGPSQPIARRKDSPHYNRSGIEAPRTLPLEDGENTYVLIVSFTVARRDYYIRQLKSGNAEERLHAIYELHQLTDENARRAIRDATTCHNVEPTYEFTWAGERVRVLSTRHVRRGAQSALEANGFFSRFKLFSLDDVQ